MTVVNEIDLFMFNLFQFHGELRPAVDSIWDVIELGPKRYMCNFRLLNIIVGGYYRHTKEIITELWRSILNAQGYGWSLRDHRLAQWLSNWLRNGESWTCFPPRGKHLYELQLLFPDLSICPCFYLQTSGDFTKRGRIPSLPCHTKCNSTM